MTRRSYTRLEVAVGTRAAVTLSDRVQHHASQCACRLCKAWAILSGFELHGHGDLNQIEPMSVIKEE